MSFTLLSVVIIAVMALSIYWQTRKGYKKGLTKSLINLSLTVLCAVAGTFISVALASAVTPAIIKLMEQTDVYVGLAEMLGDAIDMLPILFGMLTSLLLYLPVFIVLKLVVALITKIICAAAVNNENTERGEYLKEGAELYEKKSKAIGAAVGAASGFILTVVIMMPFVGTVSAIDDFSDAVAELMEGEVQDETQQNDALSKYASDFGGTMIDVCGGRMLFDMTTRITVYERTTYLNKEIEAIKNVDMEKVKTIIFNMGNATDEDIKEIEELLGEIDDSLILKSIMLSKVKGAADAWLDGGKYMGVGRPKFGNDEAIDALLDEILYVCSTATFETVDADIRTVMNLSNLFREKREIYNSVNYEVLIEDLMENGTADAVRKELEKNPHMQPVLYAIDDLVMTLISREISDPSKYSEFQNDQLFEELAQTLNSTAGLVGTVREAAVSERLKECFENYGAYVPDALNEKIAALLISGLGNTEDTVELEHIKDFFERYTSPESDTDGSDGANDPGGTKDSGDTKNPEGAEKK